MTRMTWSYAAFASKQLRTGWSHSAWRQDFWHGDERYISAASWRKTWGLSYASKDRLASIASTASHTAR